MKINVWLCQLATDLGCTEYVHLYWKDFPHLCTSDGPPVQLTQEQACSLVIPSYFRYSSVVYLYPPTSGIIVQYIYTLLLQV